MGSLQEQNISLWVGTSQESDWPRLQGDIEVDVAVIGGGITELSVAAQLKRAGAKVALIEAGRIAAGATGYTTAKVTSQHNLIYRNLIDNAGQELAQQYADANETAITEISRQITELGIDCDWQQANAHVYTSEEQQLDKIEGEVEAARALGLPASFTADTELPYSIAGAIRFSNQAMFHPRKYCLGLANAINDDGSHIYEHTRATDVQCEGTCMVHTDTGTIRAERVVLATHIPFLDQ